ncbi:alpha/beta hydrolase [Actinokineospora sp. G85]|uniref:alpha/beta hydrolase n=1 Tax=Actinokineospora sp. G85 TaxID=3406626 RepID=UPI003C73B154
MALVIGSVAPTAAAAPAVAWHGCSTGPGDELGAVLDEAGAECGEVLVPVDHRRPRGRSIAVALARVRATDPAQRRGVLVVNPGGPGVPGMEQVLLEPFMPEVSRHYDIVGVDPRFVGRSGSPRCRWRTDTFLRSAGPDRASFAESTALARRLAEGCAADRDLLPHASTRETARDLDAVRRALGERRISYLGVSYGTYLGAVYLEMFGAHADRFVLDSAVDPDAQGPALLRHNAPAIAAALRSWANSPAARPLGPNADTVLALINRLAQTATQRPLRVGEYTVDDHILPYLLFTGLYDDTPEAQADLATTVHTLNAAAHGTHVTPSPTLAALLAGIHTGAGPAPDRTGTPILCADRAASPDPGAYYRDIQAHRATEPLFGPLTRNITPCAFWPATPAEPPTTINTPIPALIVGAEGDPATPHAGQVAMHRALTGSRMITLRATARHGTYLAAGNTCVDTAVENYLINGTLPTADHDCT